MSYYVPVKDVQEALDPFGDDIDVLTSIRELVKDHERLSLELQQKCEANWDPVVGDKISGVCKPLQRSDYYHRRFRAAMTRVRDLANATLVL